MLNAAKHQKVTDCLSFENEHVPCLFLWQTLKTESQNRFAAHTQKSLFGDFGRRLCKGVSPTKKTCSNTFQRIFISCRSSSNIWSTSGVSNSPFWVLTQGAMI